MKKHPNNDYGHCNRCGGKMKRGTSIKDDGKIILVIKCKKCGGRSVRP